MDATTLLCNICPKRPKFSDVSHLLTHVASKAHLSHYFKLQVRSNQEPQAEALLDDYNQWYKANNLAKLLLDRMSSKDSRRKKAQGKTSVPDNVKATGRRDGHRVTPAYNHQSTLPDYIDPRLSDPSVNSGPATGQTRAFTASGPIRPADHEPRIWKRDNEDDSGDEGVSQMHVAPCWSGPMPTKKDLETQSMAGPFIYDPFIDDTDSFECSNASEDKERADEIARLKGVLWPGMDIFDSATEQMKRKRNQKKDESILKMMEMTSMKVEPTELVFSPTGILRKQRVISGNVDDSSPLKGETPIPKKRVARPKRVLSQTDPNAQRGPEGKRARKNIKRETQIFEGDSDQHDLYTPRRAIVQAPSGLGGHTSHGGDMDEYTLSLRDQELKSRSKFAIFRDMSDLRESRVEDQHQYVRGEVGASQPLLLRRDTISHGDFHSPHAVSHASNFSEKGSHVTVDKENIEPLLNVFGRIDPLVGWNSPALKRHLTTDVGLSPQYCFGDTQYTGYSPFECHESPIGYSFNPLAGSLSRMTTEGNPIYAAEPNHMLKAPPATRVNSPDATISEVEEDDFERLYLDGSSC